MKRAMLSTIDNPFNPFTQYDEWLAWDRRAGYNSIEFLARISNSAWEMSEEDVQLTAEEAIDEVVKENVLGMWIKVTMEVE